MKHLLLLITIGLALTSCAKEETICMCEVQVNYSDISATNLGGMLEGPCEQAIKLEYLDRVTLYTKEGNVYTILGVNGVDVDGTITYNQICN